jgi:hypothetical protein
MPSPELPVLGLVCAPSTDCRPACGTPREGNSETKEHFEPARFRLSQERALSFCCIANVGARIPEGVEFFAPPPRFVEIDPDFRYYKIVVLDNEILVVDPATREIVDVIPT